VESVKVAKAREMVVAIALLVMALCCAAIQGSIGGEGTAQAEQGAPQERSGQADDVEARLARTGLVSRLEAALGDDFGGVWFDPATAQLHVGGTSPPSRRSAEAVAAAAGMAGSVTVSSVRSSWAELEAAQERLNRHLADLFARGEVRTSVAPDRNAVVIGLGRDVSAPRRSELARESAAAGVDVSIETAATPHLIGRPKARCAKHVEKKGYCDKPIAAGVKIQAKNGYECTAGPAVFNKDRTTAAKATETFILTAGHCVTNGGGNGAEWFAFTKVGEARLIGKAVDSIHGAAVKFDVAVIKVDNPGEWVDAGNTPVPPTIVPWEEETPEPYAVTGQGTPVKGSEVCFSGQVKGTGCTKVKELNVTEFFKTGTTIEKLVEVEGAPTGFGDSGSPWFSKANTGEVLGTLVGETEGKNDVFQLLSTSFEKLKAEKALDLELLTTTNKRRHGAFKAGKYPVTVHGSTTAGEKLVTEAGTVECKQDSYHGTLSSESSTLTLTPIYKTCTAFGFAATVEPEGCTHVLHVNAKVSTDNYRAAWGVTCPAGKTIKTTAGTCKFEVTPQVARETVDLIDDTAASPKKDITFRPTVVGISYFVSQDGVGCPFSGIGPKTTGQYTSNANVTLTGQGTTEPAEKIDIEVVD
jgi:Trypsin